MARAIFSLHTTTTRHKTHLQKEVLFLRCTFSNTQQRFLGVLLRVSVCVVLILFMFLCCVCFMLCFTFVVLCLMVIEIDLFFLCFCCFLLSRWYFIPFYPFQPKFCCFLSPSTVFSFPIWRPATVNELLFFFPTFQNLSIFILFSKLLHPPTTPLSTPRDQPRARSGLFSPSLPAFVCVCMCVILCGPSPPPP